MKEPLYHMLTTHDEGLPYLLHRVLNDWAISEGARALKYGGVSFNGLGNFIS